MRSLLVLLFLAVSVFTYPQEFAACSVPDSVWNRMLGCSVPKGNVVNRAELRFLRLSHYDAEGKTHIGEMVCNRAIAQDLIDIFRKLYDAKYPIERMRLIDEYGAVDEASMTANNTSCFCYRAVNGTQRLSAHSRGMAVDINPLYNPCVRRSGKVEPKAGQKYAQNRDMRNDIPMKISRKDLAYQLFTAHGFKWGGAWRSTKDYQHFEK